MVLSEEDVADLLAALERVRTEKEAMQADLKRIQREKEAGNRKYEAKLERLRWERSLGTSLDGQGGGNSADRRGTAASTMGTMWTREVSTDGDSGEDSTYVPRGIVPKFPVECSSYEYIAWERRFEIFLTNQGLRHTISPDAPEIAVISCINDAYLFGHFGEALVTDHRRVWGYISEATAGAPFEDRLYECHYVADALSTMREWSLPLHPAERYLLVAELERVQFMGDEDPKFFFDRISRLETTMHAVGIKKRESDIVQIILRHLPGRYDVMKTMTLADPQMNRQRLENTIRSAYSQRKAHEIAKQWPVVGVPAEPSNPHALVVGRGFRDGGAVGGEVNEGTMVWHLAAVACLGSSSSCSNTGLATVACRSSSSYSNTGLATVVCFGSSSSCSNTGLATVECRGSSSRSNTGLATVACRGSSSRSNTGLATVACRGSSSSSSTGLVVVACRGSSSNSSNGLAAVGFFIGINLAPMLSLPPGRRDNNNRCNNRHGESLRLEVMGRTEVAPYLKLFLAVMAGLFRSGFSRKMWRYRCSLCWRDCSSRRRRQWYLLQQHLRLKR